MVRVSASPSRARSPRRMGAGSSSRAARGARPRDSSSRGRPPLPEVRPGVLRYLVTPDLAGKRLDQTLAALSGQSRRAARTLLDAGAVWLNAKPVRVASRSVSTGDVLDVMDEGEAFAVPAPVPAPLAILHEDGWLVAIDKPAGVASQPPRQRRAGELTAQERLALQLALRDGLRREVLLFHRLDRMTTGVMVFARHHEAARALTRTWASGQADKRYLAVVCGDPGERPLALGGAIAADPLVP